MKPFLCTSPRSSKTLRVALGGALSRFRGVALAHWTSTEGAYFKQKTSVVVPVGAAPLELAVPPMSVVTISNRAAAGGWADYVIPQRTRFPLPWRSTFEQQPVDAPCSGLGGPSRPRPRSPFTPILRYAHRDLPIR